MICNPWKSYPQIFPPESVVGKELVSDIMKEFPNVFRDKLGENVFQWLEEHQEEFDKIKRLLTSDMVVIHFAQK